MAYLRYMAARPAVTVVETPTFIAAAKRCLGKEDKEDLIGALAVDPEHGEIIPGTGGVRKVRWAVGSRGKRGSARVVYYFHSEKIPLFLLTVYMKGRKSDLSMAEKNEMRQVTRYLVESYGKS